MKEATILKWPSIQSTFPIYVLGFIQCEHERLIHNPEEGTDTKSTQCDMHSH